MQILHLVALLCCLATVFVVPTASQMTWCTISMPELQKCVALAGNPPTFNCVRRESPVECMNAIKVRQADAMTLSGENIYTAGLTNYNLVPIIAEAYSANPGTCSYGVAVARKNTGFLLGDLRGRKSCHTGFHSPQGWTLPVGTLLSKRVIDWEGSDNKPLEEAVSEFFGGSCVPGANDNRLCSLCGGDCSTFSADTYGTTGPLKCLEDGTADVAFMNPADIPSGSNNLELLCQDNTRRPVEDYKSCNLGEDPAHAVVTRSDADRELLDLIWTSLHSVGGVNLFSSESFGGKNLLFSDSTERFLQVPFGTDRFLYLGAQYTDKLQSLRRATRRPDAASSIRWCVVGHAEETKCDTWSGHTTTDKGDSAIECHRASSVEECFKRIMRQETDAVAVDGGQVYTAGKCGLVPAMVEQYDEGRCSSSNTGASSYYAVAVIKKGSGVTWGNLKGKASCHTGFGRTAGWNVPMGRIHAETNDCDFSHYFSAGCAPGYSQDPSSPFCTRCKGGEVSVGSETAKCKASAEEQYYGYAGAFRCLAEGAGDVAFIKHTIVGENTDGNGPSWATNMGLRSDQFELICPGNSGSVPVNNYMTCNLAQVPAHAVMTRPDFRSEVVRILNEQQALFGVSGSVPEFRMFQSTDGKNLLFKDSTKCLQEVPETHSYDKFLGAEYMTAMNSLRVCTDNTPDLEKSCTFQSCQ